MKTSFYFVLWIMIYPILGLFNSDIASEHSFIVAFLVVLGFSWLTNKLMPQTLMYERALEIAPVLEDAYTLNIASLQKRLSRDAKVNTVTAIYFCLALVVIATTIFIAGSIDWFALVLFGILAYSYITLARRYTSAFRRLSNDPSGEKCVEIVEETYQLNYASYYEARQTTEHKDMIPPRPRRYILFQLVSLLAAIAATLFGAFFIFDAAALLHFSKSFGGGAVAGMNFLYGSLAAYFGVRDLISICRSMKKKTQA